MDCAFGTVNPCPSTLQGPASQFFLALINALFASQCSLGPKGRYPTDYGPHLKDGDEFDFIVVGSGSAGSVVASRLSEVKEWNVLLLEAGGYPSAMTEVPGFLFSLQGTAEDWQYVMEPSETSSMSLVNGSASCPRGKGLGGSSLLNAMLYIRGNRRDFDAWSRLGNAGWDYDSVVQHFSKFENVQDQQHFGQNGELLMTSYKCEQPYRDLLVKAYQELGYGAYSEEAPLGVLDSCMTVSHGTRSNTAKAFLSKAKERKNLFVSLNSHVGRVILDGTSATGVEVRIGGKAVKLRARKEVVLSAGAINSPQILLGSQLPVKLAVGENLQDHALFPVFLSIPASMATPRTEQDVVDELYKYFMHREGMLSRIETTNFVTFVSTKDEPHPDLQMLHTIHYPNDLYLLPEIMRSFRWPEEVTSTLLERNKENHVAVVGVILLNPKSKGKIELRSGDPYDRPLIHPNYLEENEDAEVLYHGLKFVQELLKSPHLKGASIIPIDLPKCKDEFATEEYWRCYIKNLLGNVFHQVGTCKMGPREDPTAVVDQRLKVYGVKGLRVIDGSVMPSITSANTNAPIIMIGEKGSQMIKEDWSHLHQEL